MPHVKASSRDALSSDALPLKRRTLDSLARERDARALQPKRHNNRSFSSSKVHLKSCLRNDQEASVLQLVGDEPQGGWTKWTFQFRSRRLENFVFAVEVERVNCGAVSTSVTHGHVQRLVQSVQENVDEKQGGKAIPKLPLVDTIHLAVLVAT